MKPLRHQTRFEVRDYDLVSTLHSGQAFRWTEDGRGWSGVIDGRWVRLTQVEGGAIEAEAWTDPGDWTWLRHYLQVDVELKSIVGQFPSDPILQEAVKECWGLRVLRQEPWECLASFLMSSTKQIPQIRKIVAELARCFGARVEAPTVDTPWRAFPSAKRLSRLGESDLRACRMGFRARYLRSAAVWVATGRLPLETLHGMERAAARAALMALPGVGPKIADCVLLFAYGYAEAFPVDVWILKVLRDFYFGGRAVSAVELESFATEHFGPQGGYAQQYLFHWARRRAGRLTPGVFGATEESVHGN